MHGTFANRMTEADYDRQRAVLRETYGDSRQEAGARFEQELALLFYRSGWTQEVLAAKEGKSQRHIGRLLCFGRFLDFSPSGTEIQNPTISKLTERGFRKFWERTDSAEKNERVRFKQVAELIEESTLRMPQRPRLGKRFRDEFADGNWHRVDAMAAALATDEDHVIGMVRSQEQLGNIRTEKKRVGKDTRGNGPCDAYRMFRTNRTVSLDELTTKLGPILEGLEAEGRKTSMAQVSIPTIATLAGRLKQLIEEWEK